MGAIPVVLDTTYVLPLFECAVDLGPAFTRELCDVWERGKPGCSLHVSSASLIECTYKLNREYRNSGDASILSRYPANLPTITTSSIVRVINAFQDARASEIAMAVRLAGHPDLMDCWIAGTAAALNGALVTEDIVLGRIMKTVSSTRDTPVWSWSEFMAMS